MAIKNYEITERGAQVMEASVNGLSAAKMQRLLLLDSRTTRGHMRQTQKRLETAGRFANPLHRAAAMLIAGGLLKPRDIKMPGDPFIFTMRPDQDSLITYSLRPWLHAPNRRFILPGRAPTPIPESNRNGHRYRRPNGELKISARNRTSLSCLALGMGNQETLSFNPHIKESTKTSGRSQTLYRALGAPNAPRVIALAAFMGVIEIDPEILDPAADIKPTIYEESFTIPAAQMALLKPRPIDPGLPLSAQVGLRLLPIAA
ncbi:MAG TPA: hypothetical protein VF733_02830 [Candidatus Saccharimonadales bacterium]